jgi:hypothetical protein
MKQALTCNGCGKGVAACDCNEYRYSRLPDRKGKASTGQAFQASGKSLEQWAKEMMARSAA